MLIEALVLLAVGADLAVGGVTRHHNKMIAEFAQQQYNSWLISHQSSPNTYPAPPPLDSAWWRESVTLKDYGSGTKYVDSNKFYHAKWAYEAAHAPNKTQKSQIQSISPTPPPPEPPPEFKAEEGNDIDTCLRNFSNMSKHMQKRNEYKAALEKYNLDLYLANLRR